VLEHGAALTGAGGTMRLVAMAAAVTALLLVTAGGYGYHRDEL
jgi:hypothetical protein